MSEEIANEVLEDMLRTRATMIRDLTPILGEKAAFECADAIFRYAIKSAKARLGVTEH